MKPTRNVTELSTVELKSIGYDIIAELEMLNKNLKVINSEIEKRQTETAPVETVTPEKVETKE